MKLQKIEIIKGKIILQTGLHIGAGSTEMHIGGTDNPVVTHPHTREPYIPGSSLKGKIRSLLELRSGLMGTTKGRPIGIKEFREADDNQKGEVKRILKLFGVSGADDDQNKEIGPTRASFSDCSLNEISRDEAQKNHWPFLEVKSENTINRIKGTAENPRFTERVPAGMIFDFIISLKVMDQDSEDNLEDLLLQGMKLLEHDALGGSGSRGYGRITFEFDEKEIQGKFSQLKPLE